MSRFKYLFLLVFLGLFFACKKDADNIKVSDRNNFKDYILNVTTGVISKNSDVNLVLVNPVESWTNDLELDPNFFNISPDVKGKWTAINNRTISFKPESNFKPGTNYTFTVNLNAFQNVKDDLSPFVFKIKIKFFSVIFF